ncbi:hypothetical protein ACIRL2_26695 [Embleya sp. NPDC127516]|uniref:hypothetical protein n=1 Tax=Embleya sp. NPDC127516 TaxID=3363990 RepID=UPI0038023DEB
MAARMPILTFLMGLGSEAAMDDHPRLVQTVLDTTEPRILVEFYRLLLGLSFRPGDEPPVEGRPTTPTGSSCAMPTERTSSPFDASTT